MAQNVQNSDIKDQFYGTITPPINPQSPPVHARIQSLDGLRGIAILAIVLGHLFFDPFQVQILKFSPILSNITKCYPWGVHLFFVISGFLIGGILIKNKQSLGFVKSFYFRRIIRIYPLYYFLIIFVVGGLYYIGIKEVPSDKITPFWTYLVFLQNFWKHTQYYHLIQTGVTWSLAIEEQFYLLAPLLLIGATLKKVRWLVFFSIIIAFFFRVIARFHIGIMFPIFHHTMKLDYEEPGFLVNIDMILIGVLGATLIESPMFVEFIKSRKIKLLAFPFLVFIILIALLSHNANKWIDSLLPDVVCFLFLGVILLSTVNINSTLSKMLSMRYLAVIGKYCYFIYLFHMVFYVNIQQAFEDLQYTNKFVINSTSVVITIVAAAISWKLL